MTANKLCRLALEALGCKITGSLKRDLRSVVDLTDAMILIDSYAPVDSEIRTILESWGLKITGDLKRRLRDATDLNRVLVVEGAKLLGIDPDDVEDDAGPGPVVSEEVSVSEGDEAAHDVDDEGEDERLPSLHSVWGLSETDHEIVDDLRATADAYSESSEEGDDE